MLLGGGHNPAAFHAVDGRRIAHDESLVAQAVEGLRAGNEQVGVAVETVADGPVDAWISPIESVSNSSPGSSSSTRAARSCSTASSTSARARRPGSASSSGQPSPPTSPSRRSDPPVTRGRLAVHAHFYQPSRLDPWTGRVPEEPGAAPFHDWNARVDAECYRPNAKRGNLRRISWDLGPTLASWMATEARRRSPASSRPPPRATRWPRPSTTRSCRSPRRPTAGPRSGGAFATSSCGSGRPAAGLWLPETAVDLPTLRIAAEEGRPLHDPRPVAGRRDRPRQPAPVPGRARAAVPRSSSCSTTPGCRRRSRSSRRQRRTPTGSLGSASRRSARQRVPDGGTPPLAGDRDRRRALRPPPAVPRPVPAAPRHAGSGRAPSGAGSTSCRLPRRSPRRRAGPTRPSGSRERTSWSCHHGVARWSAECPDAIDGRWKSPLRAGPGAAGRRPIDAASERWLASVAGAPDLWGSATRTSTWSSARSSLEAFADGALGDLGCRRDPLRASRCSRRSAGAWRCSPATPGSGTTRSGRRRSRSCGRPPGPSASSTASSGRRSRPPGRGPRSVLVAVARARRSGDLPDGARGDRPAGALRERGLQRIPLARLTSSSVVFAPRSARMEGARATRVRGSGLPLAGRAARRASL